MKKILFALLLFLPFISQAQDPNPIRTHTNSWFMLKNKFTVSPSWFFTNELHLRRAEVISDQQQFIFRPAVHRKLNDYLTASAGYSLLKNSPYGMNPQEIQTTEQNLWGQMVLGHSLGSVNFSHRYRWEYRFMDNVVDDENGQAQIDGLNTGQRFRYRITASLPLAEFDNNRQLYLKIFDELFINQRLGFGLANFNQNWIAVAAGYQFSPAAKVELGYMHQTLTGANDYFEKNSNILVNLFYNFDFSKKEKE